MRDEHLEAAGGGGDEGDPFTMSTGLLFGLLDEIENSVKESWARFNAPTSSTVTWASFLRERIPPE